MTTAKSKVIDKAPKAREAAATTQGPLRQPEGPAPAAQQAGNLAVQRLYNAGLIKAKLSISQPDDPEEREADRVAEQVVSQTPDQKIQRKCAACSAGGTTCPKCEEEEKIQRKENAGYRPQAGPSVHSQIVGLRGGGQPLPSSLQVFFAPRMGLNLGGVRVHYDSEAENVANVIQAKAFTYGSHIGFGTGQWSPESTDGRRLLAHELAHVLQGKKKVFREVEIHPPRGSTILWFRGVPLAEDEEFVRQELRRLIGQVGMDDADSWYRAMQGRPDPTMPLPFSAHTRAFGGLRVRSPLDVAREEEQEALRLRYAPLVAAVYPQVRGEATRYLQEFEGHARRVALDVLRESETRVNAERIRYGLEREARQVRTYRACGGGGERECPTTETTYSHRMRETGASQGLIGAARDLHAKQNEIDTIISRRASLVRIENRRSFGGEYVDIEHITDPAGYSALTREAEDKRREYDLMLVLFQQRYPVLASYVNNPAAIAQIATSGISPAAAGVLNTQIYETLDNIETVRTELVPGGDVDVWKLPEIVHLTKVATGAIGDTVVGRMRTRMVDDEAHRIAQVSRWTNIALSVLTIGLALIAAIPSGGSSLVAGATAVAGISAAGLSFYQAARHLREFQMESAMTGTDFDRARAISVEQPTLFWLAVDILGAALDAAPFLRGTRQLLQAGQRTFRALAGSVERAIAARGADVAENLAVLRRAAGAAEYGGARLAARLDQSVQRIRQAGGSAERALAGATGHEAAAVEHASAAITREAEHVLAQAPTRLGGHTVKVTPNGWLVRCTVCGQLREEFASELARNHELAVRVFGTEEKAARAARTGNRALAEEAAQEGRQLADELEAFRRTREIRLYRSLPQGAIDDALLMDRRLVVDMPFVGQGAPGTNAAGWMRDASYYWEELLRRHPDAFSPDNIRRIRGTPPLSGSVSPVNDATFRSAFPQYDVRGLRGQPLIHHHIGGGGHAAAIPAPLHPGSGGIHNVERAAGIWGGEDPVAEMLQRLLENTPPTP